MKADTIDCIVVGYNDVDFQTFVDDQKRMAHHSGAYHEITTNSVLLGERRTTYMDLINHGVEQATGANPQLNAFAAPSLGVCYLKSFLCKRGFQVETVNFFNHQKDKFKQLLADKPRAVAITTTYYIDNQPISELVQFIREHGPETKIIVGGPHIYNLHADYDAATQEYLYRAIGADVYIIDSQGELTLSRVLSRFQDGGDLRGLPNVAYFDRIGDFQLNPRQPESNEMDGNSTEWRFVDTDLITPLAYMRTARSCPFSCAFCNYPTLAGQHVLTDLQVLEQEMRYLHEVGTRYLIVVDDTFNVPLPRFKQLLRMMIKNQWHFQWISFFRCSNTDEETFDLMAKSGCIGVFLGIESGDQTVLNNMNKFAKVDRYKWGIKQLQDRGIITFASLICGFPGETSQTLGNTLQFLEDTGPTFFNVQLYYHDTRSPIAKRSEEFNLEGAGYSWRHKTMNWRVAADLAKYAFRSVENSIPLSLYGFSIWSLPYLISKGIAMPQLIEFGGIARDMLIKSFDDVPTDLSAQTARLTGLFRQTELARTLMPASAMPS